jgi:hypothetical protein
MPAGPLGGGGFVASGVQNLNYPIFGRRTDWWAKQIMEAEFRNGTAPTFPAQLWLGLGTNIPVPTAGGPWAGAGVTELTAANSPGYARLRIDNAGSSLFGTAVGANLGMAISGGYLANTSLLQMAANSSGTAAWPTAVFAFLADTPTLAAGNVYWVITNTPQGGVQGIAIQPGNHYQAAIGAFQLRG